MISLLWIWIFYKKTFGKL